MRRLSVTEHSLGPSPHIKPGHVAPVHTPTCTTNMVMSSSPGPESSQKDFNNTWCFILFKARPSSLQENGGGGGGGGGGGEPDPEGHHQDFGRAQISDGSLKLQHI